MNNRVPPGQTTTENFPVLHYGEVPQLSLETWRLKVFGLVDHFIELAWDDIMRLPLSKTTSDIHCVTGWSKLKTVWEGFHPHELIKLASPKKEARYVMIHSPNGWSTNLTLEDFLASDNLFAYRYEGKDLTPEHGWPLRLTVPSLYFWKSAKWVTGVEFMNTNRLGFWERNGYHIHGDPWKSERYSI